jgi:hypothetical protein
MGTRPKKTFDAVAMSRRLRIEAGRKLANMTPEEEVAYFHEIAERFRKTGSWWAADEPAVEMVREDPPASSE